MSDDKSSAQNFQNVIEQIERANHEKVKVAITDIDGVLRGKYIHRDKFLSATRGGFGFCDVTFGWDCADVCYENPGVALTGWHTGYGDVQVKLDPKTMRLVPWDDGTPLLLGDAFDSSGEPLYCCPRQVLKRVLGQAEERGFSPTVGVEFEWFNFKETPQSLHEKGFQNLESLTPGMFGYSLLRSSLNQPYFAALMDEMGAFGVPIEGLHTETGPGVYEVAIQCSEALEAADRAVLFKSGAKEIAYRHGIIACFMARWSTELPGCSGHIHQSLWNLDGDRNLFHDQAGERGMSKTFRHFIAGQLHCLPQILPMFAPTVNSYKRLVEGYWAPTRATWGFDNRTCAFRVIPGSPKSTRVETRVSGADINPYLAVAASLASGLYGIEHELEPATPAFVGNAYKAGEDHCKLPASLEQAATVMQSSLLARELFGDKFVEHFTQSRLWEARQFRQSVTDWELKRYFEII